MPFLNEKKRVLLAVSLSVAALSGAAFALRQQKANFASKEVPLKPGETFADYRKWKRVNPIMVNMDWRAAQMCHVTPEAMKARRSNPHFGKWIFVYVNQQGEDAMMNQAVPNFPVGSVIVKEKRGEQNPNAKPELLTVMTKMPPGYDPKHGDWQYMGVAGNAARTIQARGRLANCQSCHDKRAGTGYVYRSYLPAISKTNP